MPPNPYQPDDQRSSPLFQNSPPSIAPGTVAEHPRKKIIKIVLALAVCLIVASVAVQLLYPRDRSLPFAKVSGVNVGMLHNDELEKRVVQNFADASVELITASQRLELPWTSLGLKVDSKKTAETVLDYSWGERLIPFSMVVRMITGSDKTAVTSIDEQALAQFSIGFTEEDRKLVQEPTVVIDEGQTRIIEGENGYRYDRDKVAAQIKATPYRDGASITLKADDMPPKISQAATEDAADRINQILTKKMTLSFAGEQVQPDRQTMSTWLRVVQNGDTADLKIDINKDGMKAYLDALAEQYSSPPESITITLVDGVEVARTSAASGRSMNVERTIPIVGAALLKTGSTVAVDIPVETVEPNKKFVSRYSLTSRGLSTIVNEWQRRNGGDLAVVVQEIGGQNRSAELQSTKPFVAASTYKMFLAFTVLKKIEEGKLRMDSTTDIGWRVDDCMAEMILKSTNNCATSLHNLVGWQEVDRILQAAGFGSTRLNNLAGGDKISTARDEANFLVRLHNGTLMSKKNCEYLLNLMRQQIYRTGIPAGVPEGVKIANKVGFLGAYLHDVAIVYGPKSTYVLTVLSRRTPPPDIPGLSAAVYQFFTE